MNLKGIFRRSSQTSSLQDHYPDIEYYRDEYEAEAKAHIDAARQRVDAAGVHNGDMDNDACFGLYSAVRAIDADLIIETGVASGISTTALLAATQATGGEVVSIDLPFRVDDDLEARRGETYEEFGGAAVPADATSGWAIPDELCKHWTLHEGKSQRILPEVLVEHGEFDMFVHDSEHSRLCMSFELEATWPRLREGGIIICDDVSWSKAWSEFINRRVSGDRYGVLADDVSFAIKRRH